MLGGRDDMAAWCGWSPGRTVATLGSTGSPASRHGRKYRRHIAGTAAQYRRCHVGGVVTSPGLIWTFSCQDALGGPAHPADQLTKNYKEIQNPRRKMGGCGVVE